MSDPVYLDHNATTPMAPVVLEAMIPWFLTPSNAGSRTHSFGQKAKAAVERARVQISAVLGAAPEDIVFTSGATESNNLAIMGLAEYGRRSGRRHILSTQIEHKAVLEPLARLAQHGFEIELAPVTSGGYVELEEIRNRIRDDTLLVSVMHANNETGVLQPVHEIGELLAPTRVLFHTDAAQTFGKEPALQSVLYDFASISGHKICGPQGIGALCVRSTKLDRREIQSLTSGGTQERRLRPGTVPVALAVGFGKAAELAHRECRTRHDAAVSLKTKFLSELSAVDFHVNGETSRAQSHVLNVCFHGVDSEALMMALQGRIAISNGSACTSSLYSPSHVLTAMGCSEDEISCSVRISWGSDTRLLPFEDIISTIRSLRA